MILQYCCSWFLQSIPLINFDIKFSVVFNDNLCNRKYVLYWTNWKPTSSHEKMAAMIRWTSMQRVWSSMTKFSVVIVTSTTGSQLGNSINVHSSLFSAIRILSLNQWLWPVLNYIGPLLRTEINCNGFCKLNKVMDNKVDAVQSSHIYLHLQWLAGKFESNYYIYFVLYCGLNWDHLEMVLNKLNESTNKMWDKSWNKIGNLYGDSSQ